jgi:hypothetical protein
VVRRPDDPRRIADGEHVWSGNASPSLLGLSGGIVGIRHKVKIKAERQPQVTVKAPLVPGVRTYRGVMPNR